MSGKDIVPAAPLPKEERVRRRPPKNEIKPEAPAKMTGFMAKMLRAAEKGTGTQNCYLAPEYEKNIVGYPFDHVMMQYMFGINIFPFSCIIEFAGLSGTCKSSLLFEMLRFFGAAGGNIALVETENKLSPVLLKSLLRDQYDRLLLFERCCDQEEWQNKLTMLLKSYRQAYDESVKAREAHFKSKKKDKGDPPPLEPPLLIGLDSLNGPASTETAAKVRKEGHAEREYPVEALKNATYFKTLPSLMTGYPITLIYTNHARKPMGEGQSDNESKGGSSPDFYASYRFFFGSPTKVKSTEAHSLSQQNIVIRTAKNAYNEKDTVVMVPMKWRRYVDETSGVCQETWFDWGESLVRFLQPSVKGYKYDRRKMSSELLTVVSTNDNTFHAKEVGVGPGEGVTPSELGKIIEANAEIKSKLPNYLGVHKYRVYDGA